MAKNFKTIFRKNYAYSAAPSNFRKYVLSLQANRIQVCITMGMMASWFYMRLCYTDEPLGKNVFL